MTLGGGSILINTRTKIIIASVAGWCSMFFLIAFFTNIAIGKYLHLKKLSIVAPINGVNEFLLFGVMIMFFSVCSLLKESLLIQNQNGKEKNHE